MRKAILVIVVFAEALLLCGCDALKHDICSDKLSAYAAIKEEVSRNLIAPSTAVFPDIDNANLKWDESMKSGCSMFLEDSFVDAQNKFGAMIRINYSAVVLWYDSERRWEVVFTPKSDTFGAARR